MSSFDKKNFTNKILPNCFKTDPRTNAKTIRIFGRGGDIKI